MGRTDSNQKPSWRKSHSTGNGACVEVTSNDGTVIIHDSKNSGGPAIKYTAVEWSIFLDRAKKGEFDNIGGNGQLATSRPIPQGQFTTANLRDLIRGLISDAAESDETLRRHLKLFGFIRSTIREILVVMVVGSLIFGVGIAAAVTVAGVHIAVAFSIGAGGGATFILTAALRSRRYLRAALSALAATDRQDSKNGPETPEAENRRTAA